MSPATESADRARERANHAYWHSDETVDQLAARLGITRNMVYSSVEPLPASTICVHCDRELVYANRTSRAAGLAVCPLCEREVDVETAENASAADASAKTASRLVAATVGGAHAVPVHEPNGRLRQIREDLAAVPAERAAKIGSAAAIGLALGAAATRVIRERT
jgi:hypothetical protein